MKKTFSPGSSLGISQRIRLEYFNRFLSRVFSEGSASEWLLKGGAGMLARVPSARTTLDIDLYRRGIPLEGALADIRRLAGVDLGDHFRFEYAGHTNSLGGEEQPYTDGFRVTFDIYIGVRKKGSLRIDMTVGAGITAPIGAVLPENALVLPRLVSHPYRLYPVVDQIADKVCAVMQTYNNRASSREKDLVDLVTLAVTQDIDGTSLSTAVASEAQRRRMERLGHFSVPGTWGRSYRMQARRVPYCAEYAAVDEARDLIAHLIDPVLTGDADGMTWSWTDRKWY